MGDKIAKWAAGPHCTCVACSLLRTFLQLLYGTTDGPVLSQTDLYLLQTELLINPVLAGQSQFNLLFNLLTGGFHVFLAIVWLLHTDNIFFILFKFSFTDCGH